MKEQLVWINSLITIGNVHSGYNSTVRVTCGGTEVPTIVVSLYLIPANPIKYGNPLWPKANTDKKNLTVSFPLFFVVYFYLLK